VLSDLVSRASATVVRGASRVRGERVIHAEGTTLTGRLLVPGGAGLGAVLLDEPGEHRALVRLSRSAGLPARLPDVMGVAVRVLDAYGPGAHQDLLLDSTWPLPGVKHWPLPRREVLGGLWTTLNDLDVGGTRRLLALLPDPSAPRVRAPADLAGAADGLRLRLAVAQGHRGWREVAQLELGRVAPDGRQVRFSPFVTGGGIAPAGWPQALRRRAYRASRVGPDA
jgi:hypothetical protein